MSDADKTAETTVPTAQAAAETEVVTIPAEQGEFHHQAEGAEEACVTSRPAKACRCGAYRLEWATSSRRGR